MSYKVYEEYNDSNVDWIGALPDNWTIKKLKFLSQNFDNKRIPISAGEREEGEYPYYGATGIVDYVNDFIFNEDLLLVGEDGAPFFDITKDVAFLISGKTWVNNHAHVLKINENIILDKLVKHSLNCTDYSLYIKGSTRDKLNQEQLKDIPIIIPPKNEQKQIANYLDNKTTKIDETIAKNQQLIELLEEKRTALINQVVTKGLNPDVHMKDSGVEWIGEIPEHWKIMKMKYLGTARNGLTYKPEDISDEGTLVLRSSNIQNGKLSFDDNVYINSNVDSRFLVKENDLLICSRNGSKQLIGKSALITPEVSGNTFGAFMMLFKSKYNKFIQYTFKSKIFAYYIDSFLTSTINQLTLQNFNNMAIPITLDLDEQMQISNYLNKHVNTINKSIEKINENINLLEEYKTSLIHHVVTGKIDVRGEEI